MRFMLFVPFLALLAGCNTELTPEAQLVRQIPAQIVSNCEFLGPVSEIEMFGLTMSHDSQSALNKVRNSVASKGGNAFVLTNTSSNMDGTIAQADAYRCP